jgi:hypothetical protein
MLREVRLTLVTIDGESKCRFPALHDDAGWDTLLHLAWRERDIFNAERIARILILVRPEASKLVTALLHIRAYAGRIGEWPSPRIAVVLSPSDGRALLYKRWYLALELFHENKIEEATPYFKAIAKALPKEAPFSFGANLRTGPETEWLLNPDQQLTRGFWNPIPQKNPTQPPFTMLVGADQTYIDRHLKEFLRSVFETGTSGHVHVHVCDPPGTKPHQSDFAVSSDMEAHVSCSWSRGARFQRPTYFACARFLVAPYLLRQTQAPVLIVDIDATILTKPEHYLGVLANADVGLPISDGVNFWNTVKAGLTWIAPTKAGLAFADSLANYIESALTSSECSWTLDQTALWAALRNTKQRALETIIVNLYRLQTEGGGEENMVDAITRQKFASRGK